MPRPQFTLRALLVLPLAVACFFGGIRFEKERRRREDESVLASIGKQTGKRATNSFVGVKRFPADTNWEQRYERLRQELFPTPTLVDDFADRIDAQLAEDRDRLLNRSTE